MGQEPKEAECTVEAKLVFFIEWKTVASGPGIAAGCVELVGKKGSGGSARSPGRCADAQVDIEALERLMEPEEAEVCPRCILKYATRTGSNIFTTQKRKRTILWQAEGVGCGAPRRVGSFARKLAK